MSNIFLDPCTIDRDQLRYNAWSYWCDVAYGSRISMPAVIDSDAFWFDSVTSDDYNIETAQIYWASQTANLAKFYTIPYKAKYTPENNIRVCLVRFKTKINYYGLGRDTGYEQLVYLPFTNDANAVNCFTILPSANENKKHLFTYRQSTQSISLDTRQSIDTYLGLTAINATQVSKANELFPFVTASNFSALNVSGVYCPRYNGTYRHNCLGFPIDFNGYGTTQYGGMESITKIPDSIPVFEETATQAILNYLQNGDDSGRVDPFDPNNPIVRTVTDFKSDFKTYVTRSGKDVTLKTIAYNSQYIAMSDNRDDEYGVYCFKRSAGSDGQYGNWSFVSKATQVSYPTINIKPVFNTGAPYLELFYGFAKVGDDTRTYGFSIQLQEDITKEYGFKVKAVHCYGDFWHSGAYTGTSRTSITDGYQYTQQTDNKYMQVLFRAVTLDDLHDTADDGYDDKGDTEDTSTGTTASEVCGHGLGTYKVSQSGFDAINDALWSTDWAQLFKSNTIDPVKCVISCKGIPFAHSGTATDAVYIANQRISCSSGKCNPVNTYNIGSYTIQAINNNFTDMTMTKVRVYLPYIAWVELPAEEVISRVGRAEVGLSSVTKLLNFKYIVDFVDGSCRCVISVNGTERWFFDGNCGVDIPVTSDNHTSAINNAIKSGVQTVMNVGLAVGSAYAGNPMGVASGVTGAIGSLANTIPTYNYSATANSSGYINHSMGNKIVIVIESPNIQMPNGYGHKYGFPCMRNLTLGSLSGYTKCESVDLTGINGTNYELNYIKSALESGVYL